MNSYPKIFALGTRFIEDIFNDPVEITEKIDGSQFGFGKFNGKLVTRSKGRIFEHPDALFEEAYEQAKRVEYMLPEGYSFYGEYLKKPKHNTLNYKVIPQNHIALYAISDDCGNWCTWNALERWAIDLEFSVVPLLFNGISNPEHVLDIVKNHTSFLGYDHVEGVVVKNYHRSFLLSGQGKIYNIMCGKFVTEQFKEVHFSSWKTEHTKRGQWGTYIDSFRTEARWEKAIQHLRENGTLVNEPKDIGPIIKEIYRDIQEECKEDIKEVLWNLNKEELLKKSIYGFPEWYKERLLKGD